MKFHKELEQQKELVKELEEHQKRNNIILQESQIEVPSDSPSAILKMLKQLIKFQNIDLDFKLKKQKEKLEEMTIYSNTTYAMNFEKQSRECNMNIDLLLQKAEKTGKQPEVAPAMKDKISELLSKYSTDRNTMDQETKNEFYQELKKLVQFIKKGK